MYLSSFRSNASHLFPQLLDLVFVELIHHFCLMEVVAIRSSQDVCESLLFLYFVLENSPSHIYLLPKSDEMNKA